MPGSKGTLTITFNKGGATDFARAFFQITEGTNTTLTNTDYIAWHPGKLVSTESAAIPEPLEPHHRPHYPQHSDKKNV
jgi:hypothetical protein